MGIRCKKAEAWFYGAGYGQGGSHEAGQLSWTSELGGSKRITGGPNGTNNRNEYKANVGIAETKTLKEVAYTGYANLRGYCYHGATYGTPLSYSFNGKITMNDKGQASCQLSVTSTYCLGDGLKTKTETISTNKCKTDNC